MKIYKNNVFKYGVAVFDSHERYMHWVYGDPKVWGCDMRQLYHMVDTTITKQYRIYGISGRGLELRFKKEEHAAWFQLAKGRFTK